MKEGSETTGQGKGRFQQGRWQPILLQKQTSFIYAVIPDTLKYKIYFGEVREQFGKEVPHGSKLILNMQEKDTEEIVNDNLLRQYVLLFLLTILPNGVLKAESGR